MQPAACGVQDLNFSPGIITDKIWPPWSTSYATHQHQAQFLRPVYVACKWSNRPSGRSAEGRPESLRHPCGLTASCAAGMLPGHACTATRAPAAGRAASWPPGELSGWQPRPLVPAWRHRPRLLPQCCVADKQSHPTKHLAAHCNSMPRVP